MVDDVAWLRPDHAANVLDVPRGTLANDHCHFRDSDCCVRLIERSPDPRAWASRRIFYVWRADVIERAAAIRGGGPRLGRHGISVRKAIETACEALQIDPVPARCRAGGVPSLAGSPGDHPDGARGTPGERTGKV